MKIKKIQMDALSEKHCVPCQGGILPMKRQEINGYLRDLNGWHVIENHHIRKVYTFADFNSSLAFVNKVGMLAEEENHHPNICFTWGKVEITIWTHKINGLHENDFILAAKTEKIYNTSLDAGN